MYRNKYNSGFTLIEILIAIGILVVGLAGILTLFPAGLKASKNAIEDTQGTLLAESVYDSFLATVEKLNSESLNTSKGKFKFFYDGIRQGQEFILPVVVDTNQDAVLNNGFLQPLDIVDGDEPGDADYSTNSTFVPGILDRNVRCSLGQGFDTPEFSAGTHPYNVTISEEDDHLGQYSFNIEIISPSSSASSTLYDVIIRIFRGNGDLVYKTQTQIFISPPPGDP